MFVLVVLLLNGHVWGSIRVHLLWVRHCFSSSVLVRLTIHFFICHWLSIFPSIFLFIPIFLSTYRYHCSSIYLYHYPSTNISLSINIHHRQSLYIYLHVCNGYRHRIWARRHEFKSWTWLIAFHIALISLGKVGIQLFSLQQWVNSRTD